MLIAFNERYAYYNAHEHAWEARALGEISEHWHWLKVAAEVARRSPITEMELDVVQSIADEADRRFRVD